MSDGIVLTCPNCQTRGTFKSTAINSWTGYLGYQCEQCFFLAPEDDEWLSCAVNSTATPEEKTRFFQRRGKIDGN